MAKKIKQEEMPKAQYDPKKQWQWKPEDKIEFTGLQFHTLNNALSEFIVSKMDIPTILKLAEAFTVVQAKMAEYVEKGVITEMPVQV